MTEDLHPGLGSGALREALQKWQRKYFSAGISHEMWPNAVEHAFEAGWLAALSLSSPIEPGRLTVGNVTGVLFNAGISLSAYVATRVASEFNAIIGAPVSQASSEIREALADLIKMHDERRLVSVAEANERVDKARALLAPSRQGAGGK